MALTPTSQQAAILQVTQAMLGAAPGAQLMNAYLTSTTTVSSFVTQVAATDLWKTTMGYQSLTAQQTYQKFLAQVVGNTVDATLQSNMAAYLASVTGTGKTYATTNDAISALITALADPATTTNADWGTAAKMFQNKVTVGSYYTLDKVGNTSTLAELQQVAAGVSASDATVTAAIQALDSIQLTAFADIKSGSLFVANQVYTPGGNDFINSLQDVDQLTGTGPENKLVANLGDNNDAAGAEVSPTLNNIQTIDFANIGTTNVLDLRYADNALRNLNITRFSRNANGAVTFDQISTGLANNLSVANNARVNDDAEFIYRAGTLSPVDTATLTVKSLFNNQGGEIKINDGTYGYETLSLVSEGVNAIGTIADTSLIDMTITAAATGSTSLSVFDSTQQSDRLLYNAGGITDGLGGLGIKTINGGTFTGTLNLDVTDALGGHADPVNSGVKYYATITTGSGNDTIISRANLGRETATLRDTIAAGTGTDTLKMISSSITKAANGTLPVVTGVETLELRDQGTNANGAAASNPTAYLSAFDADLTTVVLRNETATQMGANAAFQVAPDDVFTLREVGATIAASGNIKLQHSSGRGAGAVDGAAAANWDTVDVRLNDATGAADTVALTVNTDLNTSSTYKYAVKLDAEQYANGAYKGSVENLTINDMDGESNTVVISSGSKLNATGAGIATTDTKGLTGTLTLTGGTAGKDFVIDASTNVASITAATGPLYARTIEASTYASNLTLKVGNPTDNNNNGTTVLSQTIKLGTGNDMVTFDGADVLSGIDTVTDAGGTDTVRAYYTKDGGTPTLTNVEKVHFLSSANMTMDLSKATGVTELALLSGEAADNTQHALQGRTSIFSADPVVLGTDITNRVVTLQNTNLNTINFFGDLVTAAANNKALLAAENNQYFNGLTLQNNGQTTLTVNVNNSLTNSGALPSAGAGATTTAGVKAYNLGQLTAHGVQAMTVNVSGEYIDTATAAMDAATTINNIWVKDATSLTFVSPAGNLTTGTITGNGTNNNVTTFDATGVIGNVNSTIIALGDNATVKLSTAGNDTFDALGSAGKNITIYGYNGNNTITGSAQSDTIITGSGLDTINGDRGDNVITAGAGNDIVTVKDGNNAINLGSGSYESVKVNNTTGLDATKATNVIYGNGTTARLQIDTDGKAGFELDQYFAVAAGNDMTLSFTGATLNAAASTINGRLADVVDQNTVTKAGIYTITGGTTYAVADANSHLVIVNTLAANGAVNGITTVTGGTAGDAVYIGSNAGTAYTINTGAGNDSVSIGSAIAANNSTAAITTGTGADMIALAEGHLGAMTLNFNVGDSTSTASDQVVGWLSGLDIIHNNSAALVASGVVAGGVGTGKATINGAGLVTAFDSATALTAQITQVASSLGAAVNGTSVVWSVADTNAAVGGVTTNFSTYLYVTDGLAGLSDNDLVIKLVGVNAAAGITGLAGGNITAIT